MFFGYCGIVYSEYLLVFCCLFYCYLGIAGVGLMVGFCDGLLIAFTVLVGGA